MSEEILVESVAALDEREQMPGFHGRFIHGQGMTVIFWRIAADAVLPEHSHPHEQMTYVQDGELELTIAGTTRVHPAGSLVIIPSDAVHSGRALSDVEALDVFQPVREDYR